MLRERCWTEFALAFLPYKSRLLFIKEAALWIMTEFVQ